jgi:hypothetical protein
VGHWLTGGDLRAFALVPRVRRRRARRLLASAGRIQRSRAGHVELLGVRRAWRQQGSATRSAALVRAFRQRAGRAARSASTRRARPARRGCTSGRDARLPRHALSRAARARSRVRRVRLRARCPDCRTLTAVALGPEYQCHSCGREFSPGSSACRGPGATAARRWPRRRSSSCPYPEAA